MTHRTTSALPSSGSPVAAASQDELDPRIVALVERRVAEWAEGTVSVSEDGYVSWTAPLARWITGTLVGDLVDLRLGGGER
jgi:transcription elongation GreA/GreB family factor